MTINSKSDGRGRAAGCDLRPVPSTNPTSTIFYKTLIALKAGNAIIFSPHPGARQCSWKAIEVVKRAAEAAGAPAGIVDGVTGAHAGSNL